MPYGWRIELDGLDISDRVARFEITARIDQYCREIRIDLADPGLLSLSDFTQIPEEPRIEVFTRTEDEWVSQGRFFIERPVFEFSIHSTLITGAWGRSVTARLGPPFAAKVTKRWDTNTTIFSIVQELCEDAGVMFDPSRCDVSDFLIYANTYEASEKYPIEIISELASLAGYLVTTDREGYLVLTQLIYTPPAYTATITDAVTVKMTEPPEWPDFGNRIKIIPVQAPGWAIRILSREEEGNPCIIGDGVVRLEVQVTKEGQGINGIEVNFESLNGRVLCDPSTATTSTVTRSDDVTSDNRYRVSLRVAPTSIVSVYSRTRQQYLTDYALDGSTVVFNTPLQYCDEELTITYTIDGFASTLISSAGTESGLDTVRIYTGFAETTTDVIVDDICSCTPELQLYAPYDTVAVNGQTSLLAIASVDGQPLSDSRTIWWTNSTDPPHGVLYTTQDHLKRITVQNYQLQVESETQGTEKKYYVDLPVIPESVNAVFIVDPDLKCTSGIFAVYQWSPSQGNRIYLLGPSSVLVEGAKACVTFETEGASLNTYRGTKVGTDTIKALIYAGRVDPVSAAIDISVVAQLPGPIYDPPSDCCSPGDGGGDSPDEPGDDIDTEPHTRCSDGTVCDEKDKTCCFHRDTGEYGCWPVDLCDGSPPLQECRTVDVSGEPTQDNLDARFAPALEEGCPCDILCQNEMAEFGTIQSYDGASYRTIEEIVEEDYGLTPDDGEAYWEKVEELSQDAMSQCLMECGGCGWLDPLVMYGPDPAQALSPGTYNFTAKGGKTPYEWSVAGTQGQGGAEITQDGELTISGNANGAYTVTVSDQCGNSVSVTYRCTRGIWCGVVFCYGECYGPECECISQDRQYKYMQASTSNYCARFSDLASPLCCDMGGGKNCGEVLRWKTLGSC